VEILKWPDPRLTAPNAPLERFGPEEREKAKEMLRVMTAAGGVGLAAPQVGWNVRLCIVLQARLGNAEPWPIVLVNPKVTFHGANDLFQEGCLSVPGVFGDVARFSHAVVQAETPIGRVEIVCEDMTARALQHEMDHLDGRLFIDCLSPKDLAAAQPILDALKQNWKA
jgi:peptide deformylase